MLLDIIDHSQMAAELRKQIDADPKGFQEKSCGDIRQFVQDSFSTDMSIKAWWIK
ncbi:MAG: hypothetical protein K2M46_04865 [Lachnospiraceae bacterium]|nr:hypothetical protein [Lachnospiraceae bacterium]